MYDNLGAQPGVQRPPPNPQPNPFGDAFVGAGSGLIRGGLGAYGERILGSSSEYVQSNLPFSYSWILEGHWTRITEPVGGRLSYKPPIYDINAPDLYIPLMAFGTYVVLAGFSLGLQGKCLVANGLPWVKKREGDNDFKSSTSTIFDCDRGSGSGELVEVGYWDLRGENRSLAFKMKFMKLGLKPNSFQTDRDNISSFERPIVDDVHARPNLVESSSGSHDFQMEQMRSRNKINTELHIRIDLEATGPENNIQNITQKQDSRQHQIIKHQQNGKQQQTTSFSKKAATTAAAVASSTEPNFGEAMSMEGFTVIFWLVEKTTQLESEKMQKETEVQKLMEENVRLTALLDKKEAQLLAMNEQCKVMALSALNI
ncbi:hypothetical protein ACSBR2_012134 [Camellia fascicularis]